MKKLFTILLTIISFSAAAQGVKVQISTATTAPVVYTKLEVDSILKPLIARIAFLEKNDTLFVDTTSGLSLNNKIISSRVKPKDLQIVLDSTGSVSKSVKDLALSTYKADTTASGNISRLSDTVKQVSDATTKETQDRKTEIQRVEATIPKGVNLTF